MKKMFALPLILMLACKVNKPQSDTSLSQSNMEIFVSGMEQKKGFFNFYYDEDKSRMFLEVDKIGKEFLYVHSLTAGIGSNDIGLDRGQLGNERVLKFEKYGNKLLLWQSNYQYRAVSENIDERKSVAEAFASSVLEGFEIKTKTDSSYLIDITDFLLRDSHGVSKRLKDLKQGNFSLDKNRSVFYMEGTFNFPKNTEFESILTFSGDALGNWIRSVTPTPDIVTVRMHHSFISLPDGGYTPRAFDPRCGFFYISYQDYATPIEEPLMRRFIVRHRLEKKNPSMIKSEVVEPIVYYVDRGVPEPIRSALMEGASWWNQAFEAAGYKDAFQVKIMPPEAHPMDIRYNVIQWIHRATRGWSYGSGVVDPRTGEMLKGHVSLGSLRVRQDFLIATGLLQPYEKGDELPTEMSEMALARLRQLSAHEVGHTLGLAHNFSASSVNRSSVMDYPHPYIRLDEQGDIDLSKAYDDKIGAWDKVAIVYGYGDLPSERGSDEMPGAILDSAFDAGLSYITDQDARPAGGLHPKAHLWDNGADAVTELKHTLKIRTKVLNRFSEKSIRNGMPMSSLEEVLVPIYLLHRYQTEAVSKMIGGLNYNYTLRGAKEYATQMLLADKQLEALDALLMTVDSKTLKLPETLLEKIPPRAYGYPRTRETFQSYTSPAFDYLTAVETASDIPFRMLFNVNRFNRLLTYKARNEDQPGINTVLNRVMHKIWMNTSPKRLDRTIQRVVQMQMLKHLMGLAVNEHAYDEVRAKVLQFIENIKLYAYKQRKSNDEDEKNYYGYVVKEIDRFLEDPSKYDLPTPVKAPDGSPIGCDL